MFGDFCVTDNSKICQISFIINVGLYLFCKHFLKTNTLRSPGLTSRFSLASYLCWSFMSFFCQITVRNVLLIPERFFTFVTKRLFWYRKQWYKKENLKVKNLLPPSGTSLICSWSNLIIANNIAMECNT